MHDTLIHERSRLVGLCASLVHNRDAAEDLAQETLYEAWKHRSELRDSDRAAQWLTGIARNVCLRWRQRARREAARYPISLVTQDAGEDDHPVGAALDTLADDFDLERELELHELTYKEFGNGAILDNGLLVLSKIGRIAIRWSRPIEGTPKTVTIRREADGWYVCFSCADVPMQSLPATRQETGIDLGIEAFATLSNGTRIFSPGWYRKAERALKTAQRRVSRRKKGSARRKKAVDLLAKAHQKVRRQRADFHHKTALALVRANDTIYHEDLQTANMVRNHHLAKSISDAGWSQFLGILSYKAACAGRRVVAVNPAFTSQRCSGCGMLVIKGLSVRWHRCPECGTSLHRDHNAARNIEWAGQALQGGVAVVASEN